MLNTAVGLFGIHYIDVLNHWMGWNHTVDYKQSLSNNKDTIYNHFNIKGYYSSTYYSKKLNELIEDFKFNSLKLKEIDNNKTDDINRAFVRRNTSFKETIKLILSDNIKYEWIILMRYDMIFYKSIMDLNIDYENINILYEAKWGDRYDLCDDNFYMMPYNKLFEFYNTIDNIDISISSHQYNKYLKDIHYIIEGKYYSHESPTHYINRIPL